jgi:hypothetical protein
MKREEIEEYFESIGESVLLMDGFDDAIIGFSQRMNEPILAVYSWTKILDSLVSSGMDEEDASEYIDFNILGAYVGEKTPIVVMDMELQAF